MERKGRILIVDDDPSIQRSYEKFAIMEGYNAETAKDGIEGYEKIKSFKPDLVLMDINMPGMTGLELLEKLQQEEAEMPVVLAITAYGDMDAAVKAINLGAYDFLSKPIPLEKLRLSIKRSFEKIMMQETLAFMVNDSDYQPNKLVGRSSQMVEIYKTLAVLSKNKATVMISGESGTGKEVAANAIHQISTGGSTPFIPINCAAIPENLIESEIMGYVKGSFTGADKDTQGKLAAVGKGTLLLDEISELPYEFQAKLLRVLQEREYFPIGSSLPKIFEGRIIAATNRNLELEVKEGRFREDLYYRLNVVSIHLPPLRDRNEDIDLLVKHFISKVNQQMHTKIDGISREGIDYLKNYDWPGNVRELENVIVRAAISAKDSLLSRDALEFVKHSALKTAKDEISSSDALFAQMLPLKEIEKKYISYILETSGWHKGKSSAILGITRPTLDKKIEEYGLHNV